MLATVLDSASSSVFLLQIINFQNIRVCMQINGIRQRFLTKFLQVRLVEVQRLTQKKLEALEAEAVELEVRPGRGEVKRFTLFQSRPINSRRNQTTRAEKMHCRP